LLLTTRYAGMMGIDRLIGQLIISTRTAGFFWLLLIVLSYLVGVRLRHQAGDRRLLVTLEGVLFRLTSSERPLSRAEQKLHVEIGCFRFCP
jgi:hypothetical protein